MGGRADRCRNICHVLLFLMNTSLTRGMGTRQWPMEDALFLRRCLAWASLLMSGCHLIFVYCLRETFAIADFCSIFICNNLLPLLQRWHDAGEFKRIGPQ